MSPPFSAGVTEYSLDVHGDIPSIGIEATIDRASRSSLLIGGKPAQSGKIANFDLAEGTNIVKLSLRRAGQAPTEYTISVDRESVRPTIDKFLKLSFSDAATGIAMGYRLFVPDGYDSSKAYPLVLFLDGAGGRGSDNEIQLTGTQGATVWAEPGEQAKNPCFVLAPQCPGDRNGKTGWTTLMNMGTSQPYGLRPELATVYDILQEVEGKYGVDKNRIYCTGLSMGAFGTWALAIAHPDLLAAIMTASGGGDPAKLASVAALPAWVFHAVQDPVIPVSFSRGTVDALTKAGGRPKYTEYPSDAVFYPSAHASWVPAYANEEMRNWLFQQSKASPISFLPAEGADR